MSGLSREIVLFDWKIPAGTMKRFRDAVATARLRCGIRYTVDPKDIEELPNGTRLIKKIKEFRGISWEVEEC